MQTTTTKRQKYDIKKKGTEAQGFGSWRSGNRKIPDKQQEANWRNSVYHRWETQEVRTYATQSTRPLSLAPAKQRAVEILSPQRRPVQKIEWIQVSGKENLSHRQLHSSYELRTNSLWEDRQFRPSRRFVYGIKLKGVQWKRFDRMRGSFTAKVVDYQIRCRWRDKAIRNRTVTL